jgi:hypothetical protein
MIFLRFDQDSNSVFPRPLCLIDGSNKAIQQPGTKASGCMAFHTLPHLLLELLGEDDDASILSWKERVTAWISTVKEAAPPNF